MGDMCDSDRPSSRRWNRWRVGGIALLTMVLGAFSVLGFKLWYEPRDGFTTTERVLVLDADTLKPIQGIPVRFSRHDWKLRALGGSHSFLGETMAERQLTNAEGEATFTWNGKTDSGFTVHLDLPSQYHQAPPNPNVHPPGGPGAIFLIRKR